MQQEEAVAKDKVALFNVLRQEVSWQRLAAAAAGGSYTYMCCVQVAATPMTAIACFPCFP